MTLQVSFDQFPETVKRLLALEEAYLAPHTSGRTLVTSAKPDKSIVVASLTSMAGDLASEELTKAGMKVFHGTWLMPEDIMTSDLAPTQTYIAAVSYKSSGERAGVWVDAYPALPTQVSVLRTMYDEFRQTGEMDDVTFEEFMQLGNPNVVIVSPAEVEAFLRQKEGC